MEQLIVMKRRIKAVETIKKVTHAMRLVSMSSHTRLDKQRAHLTTYKEAFKHLWRSLSPLFPPQHDKPITHERLIILVGSQKGLCGTFNTNLFKFFRAHEPETHPKIHFIGVGNYAIKYLEQKNIPQIAAAGILTSENLSLIAQSLADEILAGPFNYQSVVTYSNKQKTFFTQEPQQKTMYPLSEEHAVEEAEEHYLLEQSHELLKTRLTKLALTISLQEVLFDSILSEQAARFISMDNSTRNAENLLAKLKINYNKIRQATITRELTELSASL